MNSPYRVRQIFKTVLQQVYHFKVDVIAGYVELEHTSTTKSRSTNICTIPQLPICEEGCVVRSIRDADLKAGFILIILPIIIFLISIQQVILIVASGLFSPGESQLDLEL